MLIKIILSLFGLAYVLSPFDLFPDFIIGLGWIDDILLIILLWKLYKYYIRRKYYKEYTRNSSSETKDDRYYENFNNRQQTKGESETKNPYKVLGVARNATQDQIKHAYKQLANKYHPDKVSHLGEEFRELAEERFKEIQEAYQKLKING